MALPSIVLPADFKPSTLNDATLLTTLTSDGDPAVDGLSYAAYLPADWCIGVVPHGGYLTSLLLAASTTFFTDSLPSYNQPHPIHSALTFATRCNIGAATVSVTPLKLGRQYSFVRVVLSQHGRVCIDATITHANILLESGATLESRGMAAYTPVPDRVRECKEMNHAKDPTVAFRLVTKKIRYVFPIDGKNGSGRPGLGPSVREQWVALDDGSGRWMGIKDLGYLCDMFMPMPENYDETKRMSWYPTLSLALEIKAVPPPQGWEWLFCRIECGTIKGGRMDINVVICDEQHRIVAISRHVAIVVSSARNSVKQSAKI